MSVTTNYFVNGKLVKQTIISTRETKTNAPRPYEVYYRGGRTSQGDGFHKSFSSREEAQREANRICGSFSDAVVEYNGQVIYSTKW